MFIFSREKQLLDHDSCEILNHEKLDSSILVSVKRFKSIVAWSHFRLYNVKKFHTSKQLNLKDAMSMNPTCAHPVIVRSHILIP